MTPSSSILEMRRRSVWEAADSGILLWRDNFLYFIPVFAAPVWIIASALMFIPDDFRWVSWFGLWWLKPLFERFCLQVVAVRFFRNNPDAGLFNDPDSLSSSWGFRRILKGLLANIFSYLPGDLLWRRLSPFRPATMCLRLLERPKPGLYKERKKVLASGGLNFSALLSCIGPSLELILLGGEIVFTIIILEIFFPHIPWVMRINSLNFLLFVYIAYCFNYILVGSLYVCMGFGIYINSRTTVEGWDIELLFRKFSEKK